MRHFHDPPRDLLAILGHLSHGSAHAALAHAMRASIVQLDTVSAGILDAADDVVPRFPLRLHHRGDDHRAVRPRPLHLGDLPQIDFERPIGDQLDVVDGEHLLIARVPGSVAVGDIQHGRADGLPHRAAPARFERAMHLRA